MTHPADLPDYKVIQIPKDSVIVVTLQEEALGDPYAIQDAMHTLKQYFPQQPVIFMPPRLTIESMNDDDLRSLGLTRLQ